MRYLAVAGERQLRVDDAGLAEVIGPRVERRADPDADPLARAAPQLLLALAPLRVVDRLEREIERPRQVARVVHAAVGRDVRVILRLDVVALTQLDRVEAELLGDDVHDPLDQPQVLHAGVARGWGWSGTCW